jgi:hypothetical protein
VSTARCCGQSTAAAGPRLGGGGARSATDLMAEQRASDGFGGAQRQRRGEVGGGEVRSGGRARERVSERRNKSCDFLLKQRKYLLPLDVNQRHPQPLRQRSRILHYGRRYESLLAPVSASLHTKPPSRRGPAPHPPPGATGLIRGRTRRRRVLYRFHSSLLLLCSALRFAPPGFTPPTAGFLPHQICHRWCALRRDPVPGCCVDVGTLRVRSSTQSCPMCSALRWVSRAVGHWLDCVLQAKLRNPNQPTVLLPCSCASKEAY